MKYNHFVIPILVLVFFSSSLLFFVGVEKWDGIYASLVILTTFILFYSHNFFRVYTTKRRFSIFLKLAASWFCIFATLTFFAFLTKTGDQVSRVAVISTFSLTAAFEFTLLSLEKFTANIVGLEKIIFVSKKDIPMHIKKILNSNYKLHKHSFTTTENLNTFISEINPQIILLYLPIVDTNLVSNIKQMSLNKNYEVLWMPEEKFGDYRFNSIDFFGENIFRLNYSELSVPINLAFKRLFDIIVSLFLIILLSPLFVFIYFMVIISSRGPGIYTQEREGQYGKKFKMYKFRSMKIHDETIYKQTSKADERITKIGKIIRKYSIDELPQLFNVLIGNMSLVGPRPHAIAINNKYKEQIIRFMFRHKVKPGMTGLAQIKGFRGGDNLDEMRSRTKYDIEYIETWSPFMDLKILANTIPAILKQDVY